MNVLMFTMTMLLILASMTYTRLDSFRSLMITKTQFENHLEKAEHKFLNDKAEEWYEKIIVNSSVNNLPGSKAKNNRKGCSKLSWAIFFDSNKRDKDPNKFRQVADLSKKLILNLFPKDSNVQKMISTHPDIIDNLFSKLMEASDKLPSNLKIKEISHLASLELDDEDLKLFRYELFKESDYPINANFIDSSPSHAKTKTDQKGKKKETYSLLDHLTVMPAKTRVFLASKEVLLATCQDETVVSQILEKRDFFYKAVKNKNPITNAEASIQFKSFINGLSSSFNDDLFDFSITKTNPKKYE